MSHNFGLFHISLRKRKQSSLDPFPHPKFWTRMLDRAMIFIGLLAPAALVPQVMQIYASHDVSSFSFSTWLTLGIVNVCWLLYGLIHKAKALALANLASGALTFGIVAAILLYGHA